jgi:serine phosphatase RsbU (regulator of sigma subunit)
MKYNSPPRFFFAILFLASFVSSIAQEYDAADLEGIYYGYMRKGYSQLKKNVAVRLYADGTALLAVLQNEPAKVEDLEKYLSLSNKSQLSQARFQLKNGAIQFQALLENQPTFFKGNITKGFDQVLISFTVTNIQTRDAQNYESSRIWSKSMPPAIVKKDPPKTITTPTSTLATVATTNTKTANPNAKENVIENSGKPLLKEVVTTDEKNHAAAGKTEEELRKHLEKADLKTAVSDLNKIGVLRFESGDYETAIESFRDAITYGRNLGDSANTAVLYNNIGAAQENMGLTKAAVKSYREALGIYKRNGNQEKAAEVLNSIANANREVKNLADEAAALGELIVAESAADNKTELSASYNNLANNQYLSKNYSEAEQTIQKAIDLDKELNNKEGLGTDYNNLGNIYFEEQKTEQSIGAYRESIKLKHELGNTKSEALTLYNLGNAYLKGNKTDSARVYYEASLALAKEQNYASVVQADYLGLAHVAAKKTDCGQVLDYYKMYNSLRFAIDENAGLQQLVEQREKYIQKKEREVKNLSEELQQLEKQKSTSLLMVNAMQENLRKKEKMFSIEQAGHKLKIENLNKDKDLLQQASQKKTILLGGATLSALLAGGLFVLALRSSRKNKKARIEISGQKQKIEEQHKILDAAHTEIRDSINYAQRLQFAILPPVKLVKAQLKESFILYKPKDVVAGDFYWMEQAGSAVLFAAADCTGHGVPGALVSIVCNNALNRSIREHRLDKPGEILDKTRSLVIEEFEKSESEVKDGMDISICSFNKISNRLQWAGANNPLWIIRKGATEIEELKATKQPIGKTSNPVPFTTHSVQLNPGDTFYIFSDGFADQFGGPKGKKLMSGNFKKMLLSIQNMGMDRQKDTLLASFEKWKGHHEQVDDVCVIGVRV